MNEMSSKSKFQSLSPKEISCLVDDFIEIDIKKIYTDFRRSINACSMPIECKESLHKLIKDDEKIKINNIKKRITRNIKRYLKKEYGDEE